MRLNRFNFLKNNNKFKKENTPHNYQESFNKISTKHLNEIKI